MDPRGSLASPFFQATSSILPAKKRKTDLDDQEFHKAKKCISERLWQLQISPDSSGQGDFNGEEGMDTETNNRIWGLSPSEDESMNSTPHDSDEEDDGSDDSIPDKEQTAFVKALLGQKPRFQRKVDEKIDRLIRSSMERTVPRQIPLQLCDAPWEEVQERVANRMQAEDLPSLSEASPELSSMMETSMASAACPTFPPLSFNPQSDPGIGYAPSPFNPFGSVAPSPSSPPPQYFNPFSVYTSGAQSPNATLSPSFSLPSYPPEWKTSPEYQPSTPTLPGSPTFSSGFTLAGTPAPAAWYS